MNKTKLSEFFIINTLNIGGIDVRIFHFWGNGSFPKPMSYDVAFSITQRCDLSIREKGIRVFVSGFQKKDQ